MEFDTEELILVLMILSNMNKAIKPWYNGCCSIISQHRSHILRVVNVEEGVTKHSSLVHWAILLFEVPIQLGQGRVFFLNKEMKVTNYREGRGARNILPGPSTCSC